MHDTFYSDLELNHQHGECWKSNRKLKQIRLRGNVMQCCGKKNCSIACSTKQAIEEDSLQSLWRCFICTKFINSSRKLNTEEKANRTQLSRVERGVTSKEQGRAVVGVSRTWILWLLFGLRARLHFLQHWGKHGSSKILECHLPFFLCLTIFSFILCNATADAAAAVWASQVRAWNPEQFYLSICLASSLIFIFRIVFNSWITTPPAEIKNILHLLLIVLAWVEETH